MDSITPLLNEIINLLKRKLAKFLVTTAILIFSILFVFNTLLTYVSTLEHGFWFSLMLTVTSALLSGMEVFGSDHITLKRQSQEPTIHQVDIVNRFVFGVVKGFSDGGKSNG